MSHFDHELSLVPSSFQGDKSCVMPANPGLEPTAGKRPRLNPRS